MKLEDTLVLLGVIAVVGVGGFFAVKALQQPQPGTVVNQQSQLGSVLDQVGNTATAIQGLYQSYTG